MSGLERWRESARCRTRGALFAATVDAGPGAPVQQEAKLVCVHCPVWEPCLRAALDGREAGVWGGTTERERRRALRQLKRRGRLLGGGGRRIVVRESAAGERQRQSGQQRAS